MRIRFCAKTIAWIADGDYYDTKRFRYFDERLHSLSQRVSYRPPWRTERLLRTGRGNHCCKGCPALLGRALHFRHLRLRCCVFSGCNLQCVFCQNHDIALGQYGRTLSVEHLSDIFLKLEEKGAANINLVTGTHFIPQIAAALELSRRHGLSIPIVYNTGSYEKVSSLRLLEGLVDIYLPDLKYKSSALSAKYSHAEDYFPVAAAAITEMFRQVGTARFDSTGMMRSGIIVRHLLLPGQAADSKRILRYLHNTYGSNIYISIMNQYTPLPHVADIPELNRKISPVEYEKILSFAEQIGIENGFFQEGDTAKESFIPPFNQEGLD